ncbi:serine/threonine-protein kinase gin4 [Blastocladiella emersonii ATCC 22665]|nr:serine/threonine-protein kinase gin4 [Blastocladiella emersonii ATCC 22665]
MSTYNSPATPTAGGAPAPAPAAGGEAPPTRPSKTSRIGPYIMTKTLGMGSTGRVKLGVHHRTNQKVAVKIIPKQAMSNGQAQNLARKIEREIVIMKLVQHPNVMQLYDVYETDDELYLVLEHVEGGELFDYLVKRGRLDEREACTFFQQIIFGLDYCHKHQICHRDLKPENLLLDSQRRIKIADFGMASIQQSGKMLETSCGSPHYASPEIIKGIKYDGALSDIWSCGVILYALLSGNLPFDDENIRRLLSKVKTGKFYMPPHISPDAQDLIARMLHVEPDQRLRMADVVAHPWFSTVPPQMDLQKPVSDNILKHVAVAPANIDDDIVKSLNLLGWVDEPALLAALTSAQPSAEKIYYHLLNQRKQEYIANYAAEDDELDDDPMTPLGGGMGGDDGLPRRRAESLASVFTDRDRTRHGRSENSLVTDSQANLLAGGGSPHATHHHNPHAPSPLHHAASGTASVGHSRPGSGAGTPARGGSNPHMLSPAQNGGGSASDFRGRVQSSVDPPASGSAKRAAGTAGSGGELHVTIPAGSPTSSPGTPRFHRKPRGGSPLAGGGSTSAGSGTLSSNELTTPVSASGSGAPKRSWFAALMANFKPESITVIHRAPVSATLAVLRTALPEMHVKVQEGRRNGLKCKLDEATVAALLGGAAVPAATGDGGEHAVRSVKFRIDVSEAPGTSATGSVGGDPASALAFSLQQGPMAGLHRVLEQLAAIGIGQ